MDKWKAFDLIRAGWEEERERGRRRLRARHDLGTDALAFLMVNAALWLLWVAIGTAYPWPAWITSVWGVWLSIHAWRYLIGNRRGDQSPQDEPSDSIHAQH